MKIIEVDTSDRRQANEFLGLPFRLYAGVPQWVPPLSTDAHRMLDRKRNPYYDQNQAVFYLARDDSGRTLGRLAVLDNERYNRFNQERTAFFYLFECTQDLPAAQALFAAGRDWARERCLDRLTGPKGFTVFDGIGMLVKGFEHRPAFGLPYNLPYYPGLVEACGFQAAGELVSGYLSAQTQLPARLHQMADLVRQRRGLQVLRFRTRRDLRKVIPRLKELYNASLAGTSGNVPLTDAEVEAMAGQMLWFADPRLIKIILKDDQPVGFLFAYPDISAALKRTHGRLFPFGWLDLLLELRRTSWININGAGMAEGYRGLGGTALLFSEMYKSVQECGYQHADLVQVGVENDRMQRELAGLGIDFYKTHRLYSTRL